MNYKDYIIKKGDMELGLLWSDIKEHLLTPAEYQKFEVYMANQTCPVLGPLSASWIEICHTGDFEKFINNKPNLD